MTRYTNTGRKRTYLEAGFGDDLEPVAEAAGNRPGTPGAGPSKKRAHKASKTNRSKDEIDRKHSSEARRLRRIEQKQTDTICFACREKGHAAKACPKSSVLDDDGLPRETIGVCYRCGSRKHSLSRCKKTENLKNPLPYASCFVCSQKGHLASSCPKNAGRGVYPNGGSCKLCGQTDHLARNCQLRKPDLGHDVYFSGEHTGGADEDDFHSLKRRRAVVDHEEKFEQRRERTARKEARATNPSLVNGVPIKRPSGSKPKVVAF
ncbi:Zinc finger, CCHC-type [Ceratobasidium sp. AG-Ba]|nr:Zinc finger, CCHC-type [Ceratobasidium sp. AG-Ba]